MRIAIATLLFSMSMPLSPVLAQTVFAQTPTAISQAEARLAQINAAIVQAKAQETALKGDAQRLVLQLDKTRGRMNSTLGRADVVRLKRRINTIEQRRRELASKIQELTNKAQGEGLALLALYDSAIDRNNRSPKMVAQRNRLAQALGVATTASTPQDLRSKAGQCEEAESKLRRKARLVASRIRQLRRQQKLAGDVMRTVRDQALFDEEERRLSVSRVRVARSETRSENKNTESEPEDPGNERHGWNGSGSNTAPPATDVYGAGGQTADDQDGDFNSLAGTAEPSAAEAGFLQPSPSREVSSGASVVSVVSGSRVNTLLSQDVDTLLGDKGNIGDLLGSRNELRRLEKLRVELLRSADFLARQRTQLEIEARSQKQ